MTLKTKVSGSWKEVSSLKVKINGEWKDVSTLYSKKDGAWVTVYSSGALITFSSYPYPIPVAKGWKYSTDKVNWTTVTSDSTINTSGTFTGWVKANSISLNEYYNEIIPAQDSARVDGEPLSVARRNLTSFVNNGKGYVCGGEKSSGPSSDVDVYDSSGARTTGTPLSVARAILTSFVNGGKGYVCGGDVSGNGNATVDVYDSSGNRTTGTSLSSKRRDLTSFINDDTWGDGIGYVCGGITSGASTISSVVDKYDLSGNRTTGESLSVARYGPTSFVTGASSIKGYVCGGSSASGYSSVVDVYSSNGTRTTGTSLCTARYAPTAFVHEGYGYVCGGGSNNSPDSYATVDIYDVNGNRSTGTPLSVSRNALTSFSIYSAEKAYVCGGSNTDEGWGIDQSIVEIYDMYLNKTTGTPLSVERSELTSFVNDSKGYVCGGYYNYKDVVDVYYDRPESYSAKIPITAGSSYTLNGTTATANTSKILSYSSKVSGTITYKKGTVPSS